LRLRFAFRLRGVLAVLHTFASADSVSVWCAGEWAK